MPPMLPATDLPRTGQERPDVRDVARFMAWFDLNQKIELLQILDPGCSIDASREVDRLLLDAEALEQGAEVAL